MKFSFFRRFGTLSMACLLTGALMNPAFAASADVIDFDQTGTLNIYKYNITAAEADGKADAIAALPTNGEASSTINKMLSKYALEGVEFSCFKVADITTYTDSSNLVEVGYATTGSFAHALGLTSSANASAASKSVDGASLTFSSTVLNDTLHEKLTESTLSNTQIKNTLEEYMNNVPASDKYSGVTDENGCVQFDQLPLGLYAVVETKVPQSVTYTTDSFLVSLPSTNRMDSKNQTVDEDATGSQWNYTVTVFAKNQNHDPDLDKQVREHNEKKANKYADTCSASEGDVLDFQVTSEMSPMTSSATYFTQYKFEDTLSKGLIYDSSYGVNIAFYKNRKDAAAEENAVLRWNTNSASFSKYFTTEVYNNDNKLTGESRLTVALTDKGLKTVNGTDDGKLVGTANDGVSDFSGLIMAVSYRAVLTSSADTVLGDSGNPNDVVLTYQRTNETTSNQLEDKAEVYSYGIDLTKQFEKGSDGDTTSADYKAVKFVLQNKTDKYFVNASGENGVYYVTDNIQTDEAHGTEFVPSSSGSLVINGLEADTYVLTEVNTANGYHLLKSPIEVVINSTETDIVASTASQTGLNNGVAFSRTLAKSASATVESDSSNAAKKAQMNADGDSENARVVMTVVNTRGFDLPKTGGSGTVAVTVGGVLLAALGVAVCKSAKSKKAKD